MKTSFQKKPKGTCYSQTVAQSVAFVSADVKHTEEICAWTQTVTSNLVHSYIEVFVFILSDDFLVLFSLVLFIVLLEILCVCSDCQTTSNNNVLHNNVTDSSDLSVIRPPPFGARVPQRGKTSEFMCVCNNNFTM